MSGAPDEAGEPALDALFYPTDRVPFVEWEQFSGAKSTVILTGVVTILAFVTGLSNLSQQPLALDGPLMQAVAVPPAFAQFGGVLFAFLLGLVTVGLQRQKRLAWRVAIAVVPALALLPLTTFNPSDMPLLALVAVTVPLLVRNRESFDQSLDLSPLQIASLAAILGVGVYGVVGAYAMRGQFEALESLSDAVYYVIVTIATVGYGDITPITPQARWFSLSIILFGTGAFTVAVGALIGPVIESRMATAFGIMTAEELSLLEDHVVVLGHGDTTASLLTELDDATDVVVVTPDADTAASLQGEDINILTGDPTDEAVLRDARLEAASGVVVASNDDARDVLAIIAARNIAPSVRIVAAATDQKHVDKFAAVGADEVINPRSIGGRLLGQSVVDESVDLDVAPAGTDDDASDDATDHREDDTASGN